MNTAMNNRPVTARDIAAALRLNLSTVRVYLNSNNNSATAQRVREYAAKVGYDPHKAEQYNNDLRKESQLHARTTEIKTYYCNGNFHTKEEEVARMKELREQGFSNAEIAKKIGRCSHTVFDNIGKQDEEMTYQNRVFSQKIRAQKNAARKLYVVNKKVMEYNKKVEKHNKMKAELNMLQIELLEQKSSIEQTAQTVIEMPMIDLRTVQPTALQ